MKGSAGCEAAVLCGCGLRVSGPDGEVVIRCRRSRAVVFGGLLVWRNGGQNGQRNSHNCVGVDNGELERVAGAPDGLVGFGQARHLGSMREMRDNRDDKADSKKALGRPERAVAGGCP